MENKGTFTHKKFLGLTILILLVVIGFLCYQRYRYVHLDILEFRLCGVRLELPCTADDIRACGYHVGDFSGECDYNDYGVGTIYITQDENGIVYEIYTADAMCDLEVYGNIHMFYPLDKYRKDITNVYGKPAEKDGNTETYIKYKTETEYAYVTVGGDMTGVSRVGIVADKPSPSSNRERIETNKPSPSSNREKIETNNSLPSGNREKAETEGQKNKVLSSPSGNNEKVETEYISIDDKFYLKVPRSFKRLDDEIIAEKYHGDVPDIVFSNDDITINIAVSFTENQMTDSQIERYKELMENLFKHNSEIIDTDYYHVDDYSVGQIKLISDAVDTQIYNNMIFFSYDGKLVLISFNCTKNLKDEWDDIGDFIISSLSFTG